MMAIKPVSGEIKSQDINDNLSYLDSKMNQISGGPLGVLNSEKELKQKYPNGANGFFLINGDMWFWEDNQWVNRGVYPVQGIADESIVPSNTTFICSDKNNVNLFDNNNSDNIANKYYNEDGNLVDSMSYSETHKIQANSNDIFVIGKKDSYSPTYGSVFDKDGNWIGTVSNVNNVWKVPTNNRIEYIRFAYLTAWEHELMIIKSSLLPNTYIKFNYLLEDYIKVSNDSLFEIDSITLKDKNLDFVEITNTKNIFDKNNEDIRIGKIINEQGNWQNLDGYSMTGFMEVNPGDELFRNSNGYGHSFDKHFNRIEYIPQSEKNTLIIPENPKIKYVKAAFKTSLMEELMYFVNEPLPSEYLPNKVNIFNDYFFVKESQIIKEKQKNYVYGLGDSISTTIYADTPYWKLINRNSNKLKINMNASSGARITQTDDRDDSLADRYKSVPRYTDILFVFLGTNDAANNLEIGNNDSVDTKTLKGSLNTAIKYWMDTYPEMKIAFITPIQRFKNLSGILREYSDAIIEICVLNGIPYFDGLKHSPNLTNEVVRRELSSDGLHLNNKGHKFIYNSFMTFLERL